MTRWHVLRMTRQGQQRAEVDCCRWERVCCGGCHRAPGRCACPRVIDVDVIQHHGTGLAVNRINVVARNPAYAINIRGRQRS